MSSHHTPVALVTGASAGIGLVTARELAQRGHRVVTVSRADGAGAARAEEIARATGAEVTFVGADLSRPAEAVRVAETVAGSFGRVDVLINNAGAFFDRRLESQDGHEMTFALNHLGPFALTAALLPSLRSSGARVITVSSNAALGATLQLDDPQTERRFNGWRAYAWSKLCNQLFARELARREGSAGVTSVSMHPGFVATSFGHAGRMGVVVKLLQRLFGRSPEQGADTLVWLASESELPGDNGAYFVDRRERPGARAARDEVAQARLWEISERELERSGVRLP